MYDLAKRARAQQPSDAAIADTLGWILYKRADYQQALTLFQESVQNLPDNPEIQFHLGMANSMMGRTDDARTAFRKAVAAPADFPGKEQSQRQLSSLENGDKKKPNLSSNELEIAVKERPNDVAAQIRLGESGPNKGLSPRRLPHTRRQSNEIPCSFRPPRSWRN